MQQPEISIHPLIGRLPHKDFIKFLADIEIYVDGIATMQIQNLNALSILSGMKSLNGIAPAKMTPI